jgi:hypothetical protein
MIQLLDDQLRFSFPELAPQLRPLFEQSTRTAITKLFASSREPALRGLRQCHGYQKATSEARARGERQLLEASSQAVESIVRRFAAEVSHSILAEVDAGLTIEFQRTLRIPDDGKTYPLPAGFGRFPLRHVDDFADTVPAAWKERGGVTLPMYQSEAMWLNFHSSYSFAIQIAAGKINAATGEPWAPGLGRNPQNYVMVPEQPWLDGFAVERGIIRQFVAMPLGAGYSVEEQLTGRAEVGGIQFQVFPLRAEIAFEEDLQSRFQWDWAALLPQLVDSALLSPAPRMQETAMCCLRAAAPCAVGAAYDMGLGAGGKMQQEIYEDDRPLSAWDTSLHSRCFVHLCNSLGWREITASAPPHPPFTAKEYKKNGIPWFDYYRDDLNALPGSQTLAGVKSVAAVAGEKGEPLSGNGSMQPKLIIQHGNARRPGVDIVREWTEV